MWRANTRSSNARNNDLTGGTCSRLDRLDRGRSDWLCGGVGRRVCDQQLFYGDSMTVLIAFITAILGLSWVAVTLAAAGHPWMAFMIAGALLCAIKVG